MAKSPTARRPVGRAAAMSPMRPPTAHPRVHTNGGGRNLYADGDALIGTPLRSPAAMLHRSVERTGCSGLMSGGVGSSAGCCSLAAVAADLPTVSWAAQTLTPTRLASGGSIGLWAASCAGRSDSPLPFCPLPSTRSVCARGLRQYGQTDLTGEGACAQPQGLAENS